MEARWRFGCRGNEFVTFQTRKDAEVRRSAWSQARSGAVQENLFLGLLDTGASWQVRRGYDWGSSCLLVRVKLTSHIDLVFDVPDQSVGSS